MLPNPAQEEERESNPRWGTPSAYQVDALSTRPTPQTGLAQRTRNQAGEAGIEPTRGDPLALAA